MIFSFSMYKKYIYVYIWFICMLYNILFNEKICNIKAVTIFVAWNKINLNGTLYFLTSVGDSQPLDVSSVHHNNTFLKYSVSLLGYGFYGDILKDSEKKRWMGPMRYDYSGNLEGYYILLSACKHTGAVDTLCPNHASLKLLIKRDRLNLIAYSLRYQVCWIRLCKAV